MVISLGAGCRGSAGMGCRCGSACSSSANCFEDTTAITTHHQKLHTSVGANSPYNTRCPSALTARHHGRYLGPDSGIRPVQWTNSGFQQGERGQGRRAPCMASMRRCRSCICEVAALAPCARPCRALACWMLSCCSCAPHAPTLSNPLASRLDFRQLQSHEDLHARASASMLSTMHDCSCRHQRCALQNTQPLMTHIAASIGASKCRLTSLPSGISLWPSCNMGHLAHCRPQVAAEQADLRLRPLQPAVRAADGLALPRVQRLQRHQARRCRGAQRGGRCRGSPALAVPRV